MFIELQYINHKKRCDLLFIVFVFSLYVKGTPKNYSVMSKYFSISFVLTRGMPPCCQWIAGQTRNVEIR